ncbi:MAG: nucleotidyltransferase family protein [Actinobacteria bacterium]|nr:nucleotidyltransferase family protein [Actinomycetota bacterium]
MTVAGVLLGAGGGSRFLGSVHKLLATIDGVRVVDRSLAALVGAEFDESIVVVGAVDLSESVSIAERELTVLDNPNWAAGQATSMAVALDYLSLTDHDAAVFGLADQPGVPTEAWRRVADAEAPLARATYQGRAGHPVRIARCLWTAINREGDAGARSLLRERANEVEAVPCHGRHDDIDTVEDLDTWN